MQAVFAYFMMAPCQFNTSWLQEKDVNEHCIKFWLKPCREDKNSAYCCVCEKRFSVVRGKFCINQHASGTQHKQQYKLKFENQAHLTSNADQEQQKVALFLPQKLAVRAELYWTMKVISKNQSFQSVEGLKEFLQAMFPECSWIQYFTLSPKKLTYIVNHALAPYFAEALASDIKGEFILF